MIAEENRDRHHKATGGGCGTGRRGLEDGAPVVHSAVSRRGLLGTALAAAVVPVPATAAANPPRRLVAETRILDVNGRPARVFGLIGPGGRPGITLVPGERFRVDLVNQSGARTLVHWHGQLPPWMQDGFPWPQTPPIGNGVVQSYDYAPITGTYWMHSHHELQEQALMAAPLIVHSAAEQAEDRQEVVLMLHDFSFRSPDEILAGLTGRSTAAAHATAEEAEAGIRTQDAGKTAQAGTARMTPAATHEMPGMTMPAGAMPAGAMPARAMPARPMPAGAMGAGAMTAAATPTGSAAAGSAPGGSMPAGSLPGMRMPDMTMPGTTMPGMDMARPGSAPMDLNDVLYDAFLANDRTLADPEVVRVDRSGRVRLRIINGAASSQFWIDLGTLTGRVVATDGHAVQPLAGRRFPVAIAQRLDILIDLPRTGSFPILATLEGTSRRTGIILATEGAPIRRLGDAAEAAPPCDNSLEERLAAVAPLPARPADLVRTIALGGNMQSYAWSIDGQYWPNVAPLMLNRGQRVEIELVNQTMMAHPIHLHGHTFQVIAIDGKPIQGAVRDTVLVRPQMGRVRIAFDADNPGRWAFHCHNLYHMATGMLMEVRYQGISA